MPPFFLIGKALPFGNAVEGTRAVLFGSGGRATLGRAVGVQLGWCALAVALAARAMARQRAALRAQQAAEAQAAREEEGKEGAAKGEGGDDVET